jgi:hypothetical protein
VLLHAIACGNCNQYRERSGPHQESSAFAAAAKAHRYENLVDTSTAERGVKEMEARP